MPGILERPDLRMFCVGAGAQRLGRREQDVVAGVRVERRVGIDEGDALVAGLRAPPVEVVALMPPVHRQRPPELGA